MASPIQIILNHENFHEAREVTGGGPRKDFFAERDSQFRVHKQALIGQCRSIRERLEAQSQSNIGFVKVLLRREALAKSHRPFDKLFRPDRFKLVGGGDLGEMFFESDPVSIQAVARDIASAEEATRLKANTRIGKLEPHPSTARSETGAINYIELYGSGDRRHFSVEEALTWLANPMTGSSYDVELFETPPPRNKWDVFEEEKQALFSSFIDGLQAIGRGLEVQQLRLPGKAQLYLSVKLSRSLEPPMILLNAPSGDRRKLQPRAPFDRTVQRHEKLLSFLDNHPLVRRIDLPPIITRTIIDRRTSAQSSISNGRVRPEKAPNLHHQSARSYPKLGVIDGGIGASLSDWVIDRWDILDNSDVDEKHATFIGGLAVGGASINGADICPEPDGAELVDIAVFPTDDKPAAFASYYPDGLPNFFDEIGYAVADASAKHGVRIFNMSLNIQYQAAPDQYGTYASRLDGIADANNSIFFVSVGNTSAQGLRPEWLDDEAQSLVGLANARDDGILMPAESVRSVSVAAVNPPGLNNVIPFAPARYSRRGPGLRGGSKPDIAHVGGSGSPQNPLGHGLFSLTPDGLITDGCGTSYASPLAAKTAAVLDHNIEGEVSRETLIGLLLHHARIPEVLAGKSLSGIAKNLVGFGIPPSAKDMLEGDDHQITLVFASRIRRDQQIAFRFGWPPSLITADGKCRGFAKLTLVSTPPLVPRFGAEFVRVNIDAALQQEDVDEDGEVHWRGRLEPIYLPIKSMSQPFEAERIQHQLKWNPVKSFAKSMPLGVGKTSNWRMTIGYLTRAREQMPDDGVPFTALLTISDPKKKAPIFTAMRQILTQVGVRLEDIRTAARVSTRI